jgi:hypothetical protein
MMSSAASTRSFGDEAGRSGRRHLFEQVPCLGRRIAGAVDNLASIPVDNLAANIVTHSLPFGFCAAIQVDIREDWIVVLLKLHGNPLRK